MTPTAWAVTCYVVGLVADGVGVVALVKAGSDARKATLAIDTNPGLIDKQDGTAEINDRDAEVRAALGNQALIWWSLAALITGVVVGFAGNMISTLGTS